MRGSHMFCLAVLLAAGSALPAFAQEARSQVVHYGDLNLDNPQGAHALIGRIEGASASVCGDRTGPRPAVERAAVRGCRVVAEENAVSDVDHPLVSAEYYGDRGGNVVVTEDDGTAYDDGDATVIEPAYPQGGDAKGY
jgi:UrcA family protein